MERSAVNLNSQTQVGHSSKEKSKKSKKQDMFTMNIVNGFNDPRIIKGNHNEEELHMMW